VKCLLDAYRECTGTASADRYICCVVEVPDPIKGAKIIAVVTQNINEKKILKTMGEELPQISLPKQFIVMQELPKMGSGRSTSGV